MLVLLQNISGAKFSIIQAQSNFHELLETVSVPRSDGRKKEGGGVWTEFLLKFSNGAALFTASEEMRGERETAVLHCVQMPVIPIPGQDWGGGEGGECTYIHLREGRKVEGGDLTEIHQAAEYFRQIPSRISNAWKKITDTSFFMCAHISAPQVLCRKCKSKDLAQPAMMNTVDANSMRECKTGLDIDIGDIKRTRLRSSQIIRMIYTNTNQFSSPMIKTYLVSKSTKMPTFFAFPHINLISLRLCNFLS